MIYNPFVNLARELLKEDNLPYAIKARATIASVPACPEIRSAGAQNFLSDLGVRYRRDPAIYLDSFLKSRGDSLEAYTSTISPELFYKSWKESNLSENDMAFHVDTFVNFAGQWDFAAKVGDLFWNDRRNATSYLALTYFASAIGNTKVVNNKIADEIYLQLLDIYKEQFDELVITYIRYCSRLIKRVGNLSEACVLLKNAKETIKKAFSEYKLSFDDKVVYDSVCDNLSALIELKSNNAPRALRILSEAARKLESLVGNHVVSKIDPSKRIIEQINGNILQLYLLNKDYINAMELAKKNLIWVTSNDYSSLSEAESFIAYTYYLSGQLEKAEGHYIKSLSLSKKFGLVSQVELIRKTLCVIYAKTNNQEKYLKMYEELKDDPAGLK